MAGGRLDEDRELDFEGGGAPEERDERQSFFEFAKHKLSAAAREGHSNAKDRYE